jgi:tetratricopeptide (TPR) repeat protein
LTRISPRRTAASPTFTLLSASFRFCRLLKRLERQKIGAAGGRTRPESAEAYASLGFATLAFDWNVEESERLFRISFALNDNFAPAHEWFAHVLATEGRFEEAIAEMKHALRIDPQSSQLNSMTAYIYHNARRHREGAFYIERALELEPNNYLALQGFGWMYPPLGREKRRLDTAGGRWKFQIARRFAFGFWRRFWRAKANGLKRVKLSKNSKRCKVSVMSRLIISGCFTRLSAN